MLETIFRCVTLRPKILKYFDAEAESLKAIQADRFISREDGRIHRRSLRMGCWNEELVGSRRKISWIRWVGVAQVILDDAFQSEWNSFRIRSHHQHQDQYANHQNLCAKWNNWLLKYSKWQFPFFYNSLHCDGEIEVFRWMASETLASGGFYSGRRPTNIHGRLLIGQLAKNAEMSQKWRKMQRPAASKCKQQPDSRSSDRKKNNFLVEFNGLCRCQPDETGSVVTWRTTAPSVSIPSQSTSS